MFSLIHQVASDGLMDHAMLRAICEYFASHGDEPIKSIVYYNFAMLVMVCVRNSVRLKRLLR